MQRKAKILIVEDDVELAQWMREYLTAKDYDVVLTHRGDEAVALIQQHDPDVVILDGMLPGLDGMDVCKAVRPSFMKAIIMVTARDEEIDEVLGLEMGADDYLTKPIRARALLARIRKHIDRQTSIESSPKALVADNKSIDRLQFNQLIIDKPSVSVSLDGINIKVSSNEFEVLWLLAINNGKLVSRDELVSQLRGFDYDGFDRTIDLRVSRLRKKLHDEPSDPTKIKTIWGKGYLFVKDAW